MSTDDVGSTEYWRDIHESQRAKRAQNKEASTGLLMKRGIFFTSHNDGVHLIVNDRFDFWPSTGRWIERKGSPRRSGRGVWKLIRIIEREAAA